MKFSSSEFHNLPVHHLLKCIALFYNNDLVHVMSKILDL